ncbi:hypothetical protein KPH14_011702 [Odynerus spinipes]|uniref:Uncharacterized protein n=1 Tax=Odynerus spinipes TaxID=1348599 RepID=A0AAD9RVE8_9HYME|nr:hypothetical protein KPH14_011702 [Odynerus spinipes]
MGKESSGIERAAVLNGGSTGSNSSLRTSIPDAHARSSRVWKDPLEGIPYRWQQQARMIEMEIRNMFASLPSTDVPTSTN